MLTLSLMRHAKSSWADPGLDDHERGLAKRGTKAAPRIGRYLNAERLKPDLVLCSGAVRARATLALLLAEFSGPAPEIRYDDTLYLVTASTLLDAVRKVEARHRHVLMVGHNPGLHALALELTGGGSRNDLANLATAFPTAALAMLTFDEDDWSRIRAGSGRLMHFISPRSLER